MCYYDTQAEIMVLAEEIDKLKKQLACNFLKKMWAKGVSKCVIQRFHKRTDAAWRMLASVKANEEPEETKLRMQRYIQELGPADVGLDDICYHLYLAGDYSLTCLFLLCDEKPMGEVLKDLFAGEKAEVVLKNPEDSRLDLKKKYYNIVVGMLTCGVDVSKKTIPNYLQEQNIELYLENMFR